MANIFNQKQTSAQVVVNQVLKIKKGEKVLIIANPKTAQMAQDLYTVCADVEADIAILEEAEREFWRCVKEDRRPALILPEI